MVEKISVLLNAPIPRCYQNEMGIGNLKLVLQQNIKNIGGLYGNTKAKNRKCVQ